MLTLSQSGLRLSELPGPASPWVGRKTEDHTEERTLGSKDSQQLSTHPQAGPEE